MIKVTIQLRATEIDSVRTFSFDDVVETGIHAGLYWVRSAGGTTRIPIDRIASVTEQPIESKPQRETGAW